MDSILVYVLAGFLAQMVDGSLGMGYKVSSTTFLLSIGLPPVLASASVHTAGIVTSAVSGFSHYKFGNFNRDLIVRLAVPGVIGGVIGALLLTNLPTAIIKPAVALYLMLMGLRIVLKGLSRSTTVEVPVNITVLGVVRRLLRRDWRWRLGADYHVHAGGQRPRTTLCDWLRQHLGMVRHHSDDW
jgi:uncharacterized membrane protein YfcA